MTLAPVLAGLNVWCGVVLSVAGSLAAAPKGLPELARMLRAESRVVVDEDVTV